MSPESLPNMTLKGHHGQNRKHTSERDLETLRGKAAQLHVSRTTAGRQAAHRK
ncbi:hypothetical protein CHS0354_010040, partial [Potamilus streckersoni]